MKIRPFITLLACLLPLTLVGCMELAEGLAQAAAQQSGSTYTPRSSYSSSGNYTATTTSSGHTEYSARKSCYTCSGSGTCSTCRGSGLFGAGQTYERPCYSCSGSTNCHMCGGSGRSRF